MEDGTTPASTKDKRLASYYDVNYLSRLTIWWMFPFIWRARQGRLHEDDFSLGKPEGANECHSQFTTYWTEELTKDKPSLLRALRRAFWHQIAIAAVLKLIWGALVILSAYYFVNELVPLLPTKTAEGKRKGWILTAAFFVCSEVFSLALQQMVSHSTMAGIRLRTSLVTAVYQKSLRVKDAAKMGSDILNLVSSDCHRLLEGATYIHYIWSAPLESLAIAALLIYRTRVAALPGVGLLVLIVPLQYWFAAKLAEYRSKGMAVTNTRVRVMNEVLLAIKMVKFYAWERRFADEVARLRAKELSILRKAAGIKTFNLVVVFVVPPLMALAIYGMYIREQPLTPAVAFVVISLFNTLRFPLVVLPRALRGTAESVTAIKTIQEFLLKPEYTPLQKKKKPGVKFTKATFGYDQNPVVHDLTLELPKGKLLGIAGPVGSGKTSIISAILGEATLISGSFEVGGRMAYVPQTPWVQCATVRDNILFGQPYDEERYRQVIFACALEADLKIMPQGDQTEIGERGINMSGGQKQRIALARAAYSTAQLFLLDSPLSAVDSHTSTHIMKYCIQGLLKDKTILIVTHQFEVLEQCDLISIIRAGGKPAYFGPYSKEAMKQNFPTWTDTHSDTQHDAKEEEKKVKELNAEASSSSSSSGSMEGRKRRKKEKTELDAFPKDHELDDEEDRALDTSDIMNPNVKNTNPWILWARVNGWFWSIVSISLFVIAQCVRIASDYWITMWTKGTVKVNGKPLEGRLYMMYYSFFVAAFLVFLFFRGIVYYTVVGRGASRLHNRMFRRIIRAPIGFFTVTPTGPLLNCFSSDQDCVDESLPDVTHMTLIYTCILLTTLVLVCIVLPYYTIVAVVLLFCFILVQWFSSKGLNQLKVMASNASEPIFQHVSETVSGISVVRAYELQKEFSIENMKRLDRNHSAIFHMEQGNLWVSFWLDLIGSLLVLATAAFAVGLQLDSSLVGLAITSSVQILVFFSMIVKGFSSMRTDIHAVGRVNYYTNVARTEDEGKNVDLDVDFPPEGKVSYKKLTMSYFQNSPIVLDNVSFTIKAGEKVGVVGRTGSGKSTLLMALFRLVEAKSGKIVVDGVNTHDAGLSELRSSLAIIPQEPVCFAGTVRSNLDPFNEHTDEELWKALKLAHLHKFIKSLPGDLYSAMAENGNNFSLGQRQLMCLARAILKDSSILVLDEATSAMDLETDSLIQHTIRKVFAKSTTITIAHRLDTIIDSDKILVMGNGKVQEFDTPRNLLSNPNSQFSGYVKDAGLNVASILAHPHPEADGEEVPGA